MKIQKVFVIALIFLSFYACKKEGDEKEGAIYNTWEIVDFMGIEAVVFPKTNNYNPVIEFMEDGNYTLKLDANSCMGTFELLSADSIKLTVPGCTKICCDSRYSEKIAIELGNVRTYSIKDDTMKLNVPGWGWLELVMQN